MSNNTGTNSALARELNVSLPTVKKMWLSIYDRVAARIPEWMAEDSQSAGSKRGKEKKRRLLAYLQDHPEELRPVLRRSNGQKTRPSASAPMTESAPTTRDIKI